LEALELDIVETFRACRRARSFAQVAATSLGELAPAGDELAIASLSNLVDHKDGWMLDDAAKSVLDADPVSIRAGILELRKVDIRSRCSPPVTAHAATSVYPCARI